MMDICVVGNGPSLLQRRLGEKIDSFHTVMRFTAFKTTEWYQPYVGMKTTIWSTFRDCRQSLKGIHTVLFSGYGVESDSVFTPRRDAIMAKCASSGVKFQDMPKEIISKTYVEMGFPPGKHWTDKKPTSGLVGITYAITVYPYANVYVCGFDGCQKGKALHYYSSEKTSDNELRKVDVEKERAYYKQLVNSGRIIEL